MCIRCHDPNHGYGEPGEPLTRKNFWKDVRFPLVIIVIIAAAAAALCT